MEAAAVGSSEPEHGPLSGSWSLPLPDAPSAGSGSELSEASSHVWDEHSWEPCPGPGHLRDAETSSPDPGALQEDSRTCDGLAIRSKAGETKRASTGEACPAVTSHTSSSRLSLTSASAEPAPQQERPQHATPQVPPTAHAPSGGPCGGAGGGRSTQEAGALQADHILTEILSPVDEQLSYGSADLPSSSLRDAGLPAGLQADSHAKAAGPYLEDGVLPQGWPAPLGPPGEDTCAAHLSSPSREEPELSLAPFGQGVPGDPGAGQLGSCWPKEAGSAPGGPPGPSAPPLTSSSAACEAGGTLSRQLAAGNMLGTQWRTPDPALGLGSRAGEGLPGVSGSVGVSGEGAQGFEGATCQRGVKAPLDGSRHTWDSLPVSGPSSSQTPARYPLASLLGTGSQEVVDLVSTQLSRSVLYDSLQALAALAPRGGP